jgi:hypothetical protein
MGTFTFAQIFEQPVEYNNFIVEEMNVVVGKNLEYISQSVHSDNFEQIELKRKNVLKQIESSYNKISTVKPYEKGQSLQSECVEVLNLYKSVFGTEMEEVNILKEGSQASFEAMESYFMAQDKAEKKLAKTTNRFYKAQKSYLKSHDIKMEVSEDLTQNNVLQEISDVNQYVRDLYLIYFQMSKYSSIFLEAVGSNDKGGIDGKRKRLAAAANRAIGALDKISGFKGDKTFLNSTKENVRFYKDLAENGFVDIVKVIKTKQEDLTQDDVNAYNEAIEKLNTKAPPLNNAFNQAQMELLKKHIPKHNVMNNKVKRI